MAPASKTILIVDDEQPFRTLMKRAVEEAGYSTCVAASGIEALAILEEVDDVHAVVLDIMMPGLDGLQTLKRIQRTCPEIPVIMVSAKGEPGYVVEAIKGGAVDYLKKPFDDERLHIVLHNAVLTYELQKRVHVLEDKLKETGMSEDFIGRSRVMIQVFHLIDKVSRSDATVLITGESGTGKEMVARNMHHLSQRSHGPFVVVNCGAIPDTLIESELFGYEKGAFTGAVASTPGRFELANGGSIFLDEIGEMKLETQVRLLRAIQEREVQRIGGTRLTKVDIRLLVATNKNLWEEVQAGRFREDLYYRISVFPIEMPPLRQREGDIAVLAHKFLERFNKREGKSILGFEPETLKLLEKYPWPGNVRELMNLIERMVLVEDGNRIRIQSLPENITRNETCIGESFGTPAGFQQGRSGHTHDPDRGDSTIRSFEEEEKKIIRRALKITKGNIMEAAGGLKLSRATLYRKIRKYSLRSDLKS